MKLLVSNTSTVKVLVAAQRCRLLLNFITSKLITFALSIFF